MTDRAEQVWEHEDGETIYVVERSEGGSWWTTFSYHSGRLNRWATHDSHFSDWDRFPELGWTRLV